MKNRTPKFRDVERAENRRSDMKKHFQRKSGQKITRWNKDERFNSLMRVEK